MTIILWIVGAFVGIFLLLWLNAIRGSVSIRLHLNKQIEPAIRAVCESDASASELIARFARNPATRNHLFSKLAEMGKAERFPGEFRSLEMIAESDMVRWLMHPNELRSPPDAIEFIRDVTVCKEGKRGRLFLFRFRTMPPHWTAERGWMAGLAGPFWEDEPEVDRGGMTFSELVSYTAMTDDEHVEFLRAATRRFGLVVPS
jgi:hypothetical protein